MSGLTRSAAWRALERHAKAMAGVHLRELFAADPDRFARFSLRAGDLLLDYSKNRVTEETIRLLLDLAREGELEAWRARMFAGDKINTTENRAVLHVALRNRSNRPNLSMAGTSWRRSTPCWPGCATSASGCAPALGAAIPARP